MTVHPAGGAHVAPRGQPPRQAQHQVQHPLAVIAFVMASAVAVFVLVAAAVFSIALAVGGEDATSDNWVGALAVVALLGGLLTSLGAFVVAAAAWISHERTRLLWLPLVVFPALLAFVVLGEMFWWD